MCRYDVRKRTIPWFEWDSAGPGLIGTMCDPRSRARADLWRLGAAMAFAGGHGGPGVVVHGPLSLACERVMGMMKRGARVDVKVSYVALGVGSRAERSGTICLAF